MKKILFIIIFLMFIMVNCYSKDYIIGVVPKTMYTPYWKIIEKGVSDARDDFKVKIIYRGPSYYEDVKIQIKIVENMINEKVDAIVLAPADKHELSDSIEKAIKNGIKVVIIDSAVEKDSYDCYVSTDNYKAGKKAAEEMLKKIKDKNNILLLKLKKGNSSTEEREKGFIDGIKTGGGVVKYSEYGGTTIGESSRKAEMLIKNNNISGIFMSNGILTEGVIVAIRKLKKREIFSIGFDNSENIKEGIEKGIINGVIIQNPYKIGYIGVRSAVELLKGMKVEKRVIIESDYIDNSRVSELK
jgi:ribose transport system substrate-binding protein